MRKTKIVCTIGPASSSEEVFAEMCKAGLNVARLNFSHGTHEEHQQKFDMIHKVRKALGLPIAIMLDTKGPEYRICTFKNKKILLQDGDAFTFTTRQVEGDGTIVGVSYAGLANDLSVGDTVLVNNGLVIFTVERIEGTEIHCRVVVGGELSDRKSMSFPHKVLEQVYLSEQDKDDLLFGIRNGIDFVAASFVSRRQDVLDVRNFLDANGGQDIEIIAKIENQTGIDNVEEICEVCSGIMIGRGDLGVEVPFAELPAIQKYLITKCRLLGKRVITATEMLESMIHNPRPTRAEISDVANAVYDGTSAIMLSGESAVGAYPVEAVETMVRIALRAEADMDYIRRFSRDTSASTDVTNAISHATVTSAHDLNASAIITVTKSGSTARILSRYRPACVIVGCTTEKHVWRQLALSWGTVPLMIAEESNTDDLFEHAVDAAVQNGLVHDGELVVLTAGVPLGISGTTNLMKVHVVGHLLSRGQGLHGGKVIAPLCVIRNLEKDAKDFNTGDVIVCHQTTREMFSMLRKSSAIVLEDDNPEGHGAIAGMSLDIPVIIGAKNATNILKSGAVVTVDGEKGTVSAN